METFRCNGDTDKAATKDLNITESTKTVIQLSLTNQMFCFLLIPDPSSSFKLLMPGGNKRSYVLNKPAAFSCRFA